MKESLINLKDGLQVNLIQWQVEQPRAHVLLAHGYAEHAGRYDRFANFLNTRGISVTAYDQRGHGKSEGARAYIKRFEQYVLDLKEIRDMIAGPIFLMGHSMGSLLTRAYISRWGNQIKGAIICATGGGVEAG